MELKDIKRVLVIGAGTMGQQIALQCAMHGYDVTLYDVAPAALERARAQIQAYASHLAQSGRLTAAEAQAAVARIGATTDPAAAADCDLVSESVPEDPALKGRVFAQFSALCPARTIFTTNTSTLLPSMYAKATGRPAQFAAMHFHGYVWDSNVTDVMPHPGTAPEVVALLRDFALSIGQIPIVLQRESSSYVFNAMLNAVNSAAMHLVASGIASVEDVDRAWMAVMKTPIGPLGILDMVGLDTAWDITEFWATTLGDPQIRQNADLLKGYVDRGWLGLKAGRGFYQYPDPAFARPDFLTRGA
jgi:3-hydroxybutyryl-CoA dehydrogenase